MEVQSHLNHVDTKLTKKRDGEKNPDGPQLLVKVGFADVLHFNVVEF